VGSPLSTRVCGLCYMWTIKGDLYINIEINETWYVEYTFLRSNLVKPLIK